MNSVFGFRGFSSTVMSMFVVFWMYVLLFLDDPLCLKEERAKCG